MADRLRDLFGVVPGPDAHQHSIHSGVAALRGDDRLQQSRHAGAVEEGVRLGASAALPDGVVVLEKLRCLRVLERDEYHGVAAGRDHAPCEPDHGVGVAPDLDALSQRQPAGDVGHGLVVAARDVAPCHQIGRPARCACLARRDADHHGAHVVAILAHLHGEVGDIGRLQHPGQRHNAAPGAVVHAGWLGIGAQRALLHHPDVGTAVVQQRAAIVHHAAVHTGHGQRHANQQAQADTGEDKLAPGMQDVAPSQADHRAAPAMRSTTLSVLRAFSTFSL